MAFVHKPKVSIDTIIDDYKNGMTPLEIAEKYQYRRAETIIQKLRKAKVYEEQSVDKGKIFALQKAGWSVYEIAEDMHLEEYVIQNVLKN